MKSLKALCHCALWTMILVCACNKPSPAPEPDPTPNPTPDPTPTVTLEAVDLGLKVIWADRNLGADSPSDFGDYFAWGETATETFSMAAEVIIDAVTAAINGGDDYRLIYTIPLSRYEEFKREIQTFDVIGHLAHSDVGSVLVTPDGAELPLKEI